MAINVKKTYTGTGAQEAIPLNRHGPQNYSVEVNLASTGTYTVEVTLDQINRPGVNPVWHPVPAITGIVDTDTFDKIVDTPLEAIRINPSVNASGIDFHIMQNTYG